MLVISRHVYEDMHMLWDGEVLEVVNHFPYLGTYISRSGKINEEIGNRINNANSIYYQICNSLVGHWNVEKETKLHIYKTMLTYANESWVMFDKLISRITGAEMKYLQRVVEKPMREHFRNKSIIRDQVKVTELKRDGRESWNMIHFSSPAPNVTGSKPARNRLAFLFATAPRKGYKKK